ncbi:transposase [uncultured Desulfobacter sp.]|uniref:transposase n=1 Tax=uncultured Desulfobacter sp. TaxID=240139 RepID=UPI00338D78B6
MRPFYRQEKQFHRIGVDIHVACWIHARRKFMDVAPPTPQKSLLGKAINYTLNQFTKKI